MNVVFAKVRRLYPVQGIDVAETPMGHILQLASDCEGARALKEGVHAAFLCSHHVPAVSAGTAKDNPVVIGVVVNPTGQDLYNLMQTLKH
jgi:hypothetical protein